MRTFLPNLSFMVHVAQGDSPKSGVNEGTFSPLGALARYTCIVDVRLIYQN